MLVRIKRDKTPANCWVNEKCNTVWKFLKRLNMELMHGP